MSTADASKPASCRYCGMLHEHAICSRIRAIEYHPDGTVKRVEFHGPPQLYPYLGDYGKPSDHSPLAPFPLIT